MANNQLRNLDLGTLRSFVTIAEAGSMTRAAARLFMTQSAISMQIKRLEDGLGFSVFERSRHGMKPTSEGEQLLHYARGMLALNDEAMGRLTSPDFEGQVRLGAPCDVIYPHIPGVLKEFSRDYPRVQVRFASAKTYQLKEEFAAGQHDIVITTEAEAGEGGRVVNTQPLVWIGALDGNAWKQRPLPLGISMNCAFRGAVTDVLDAAGIAWTHVVSTEDIVAAEAMVAADLCVCAELASVAAADRAPIDHGGALPELPPYSIVLYAAEEPENPIVQTLVDYLLRAHR